MSSWSTTRHGLKGFAITTAATSLLFSAACGETDSKTGLNPDGPPMVRQVFVHETIEGGGPRIGLAFGDHPDIEAEQDDRVVMAAVAKSTQPMRIVLDELVVGNTLEEIGCTDGSFERVPLDADPDDIAACSPAVIEFGGCTAVCANVGGIKDEDGDGAPDIDGGRRMLEVAPGVLAVSLNCDGTNIPFDPFTSFYSPAGNQQIAAGPLGINSLGPAIVLRPISGLRSGAACALTIDASVVDKEGLGVCAPQNGDINQSCTPGDLSLVAWRTEVLALRQSDPGQDAVGVSTLTGAGPNKDFTLLFTADLGIDTLVGAFALIENPGAGEVDRTVDTTLTLNENDASNLTLTVAGGLAGDADYELRIAPTLTDTFGGALPQMSTLSFSTGTGPVVDAGVDAAIDAML